MLVALLFFFTACFISVDFFISQIKNRAPASLAVSISENPESSLEENSLETSQEEAQNFADSSLAKGSFDVERENSELPQATDGPEAGTKVRRSVSGESLPEMESEEIGYVRGRKRALPEFSYEREPESLKISLTGSTWKGGPQVLPDPMFVSQLREKGTPDIRGGGWVVVDVVQSKITPVELFKAPARRGANRMIEAKYIDGRSVVNPSETGFPIVRGVPGMQAGDIEVFENPPCLVRYSNSLEEENCDLVLRGSRFRFKFVPPKVDPEAPTPDFIFTEVLLETGRGRWTKIISFNESFHPIGDVNRDGAPDFYVRSVTAHDESGILTLLLSHSTSGNFAETKYWPYSVRFKSH